MGVLEEDLKEFRIKSEGWREAAQKPGGWFRWAENGAEATCETCMARGRAVRQSDMRRLQLPRGPLASMREGGDGDGGGEIGRAHV